MKTLNDYILDAQRKEERFLGKPNPKVTIVSNGTAQNISDVLHPNVISKTGVGCHNKATARYYDNLNTK